MPKQYYGRRSGPMAADPVIVIVAEWSEDDPERRIARPLEHHVRHSPDGFNWGYGGSGPAELARCILLDLFDGDEHLAGMFYQRFKWAFIAPLEIDQPWSLDSGKILEWLEVQEGWGI